MTSIEDHNLEERPDERPDPRQASVADEKNRLVLQQISKLPPRQSEAVRLKFQNGLSYKEIADIMETSVGNVGYLVLRAQLEPDLRTA